MGCGFSQIDEEHVDHSIEQWKHEQEKQLRVAMHLIEDEHRKIVANLLICQAQSLQFNPNILQNYLDYFQITRLSDLPREEKQKLKQITITLLKEKRYRAPLDYPPFQFLLTVDEFNEAQQ